MLENDTLYIVLISVHGLIRGHEPELGRDADTGGQVRYVLDLARALSEHPRVGRVDLLTRQILSLNVDSEYAEHQEQLAENAWIVRLPCGPHRYLHKESLWPHLPEYADHALRHFREIGRVPDVVHGHYADGGEVALQLARLLGLPLVFTGHSLGRVKRERLASKGMTDEKMEKRYRISRRIAAEERVLASADLVVTSTDQEVSEQYGMYESELPNHAVIPPGIHLESFHPPQRIERKPDVAEEIERFLQHPRRPWILALQRPDERKNLGGLIQAFGEDLELRRMANLVLLIGSRENIRELPSGQRRVLNEMLQLIDDYDLYGSVAYPKTHNPEEVPEIYRWAARNHGVFVNPALTEPFGLTLIEAAASGLPVVATHDGGPQSILSMCRNGLLVDPEKPAEIAAAIRRVLEDKKAWRRLSRSGVRGSQRHYSWKGHVEKYLKEIDRLLRARRKKREQPRANGRLVHGTRMFVSDIDHTLTGDEDALEELIRLLESNRADTVFAVATGRTVESTLKLLKKKRIPQPEVLITAVGSEIHYGGRHLVEDTTWIRKINHQWEPQKLRTFLAKQPGLSLQPDSEQRRFKLSYYVDEEAHFSARELSALLRQQGLAARIIYSSRRFLDLLPRRAGKGAAVLHVAERLGLNLERVVVAGDSGNDRDMLNLGTPAIVVANHGAELASLRQDPRVYFSQAHHAAGIIEGLRHHHFFEEDA